MMRRLEPRQWETLVRICRTVKETLLSDGAPATMTVHLPGAGPRVIGGGLDLEVTRDEVQELLVEGFLPQVPLDALPQRRQSGFQEFGLPYAPGSGNHSVSRAIPAKRIARPDSMKVPRPTNKPGGRMRSC